MCERTDIFFPYQYAVMCQNFHNKFFDFIDNKVKMSSKQEKVREKIVDKFLENTEVSYRSIAKSVNEPEATVRRVIKRFLETKSVVRKEGSGRQAGPSNPEVLKKLKRLYKRKPQTSERDAADTCLTSKTTVHRYKNYLGLHSFIAQKTSGRSESDEKVVKRRARKLYTKFLTKLEGCVIMDDETYVKSDFKQLPGKTFYVAAAKKMIEKKYRKIATKKFAKKYLVWQAICSCGKKSKSFVTTGTINKTIYIKECLEKRLLPFIREHIDRTNKVPLFWPDLASCHYAKDTIEWYTTNNVRYVPRDFNPANCPEIRPIERYWAIVKRHFKKSRKEAKSIDRFKVLWRDATGNVDEKTVQTLMEGIKRKTRLIFHGEELD